MTFTGTTDGPGGPDRDEAYEEYEEMFQDDDESYIKMKRVTPREPSRREKKESRFKDEIAYRDM